MIESAEIIGISFLIGSLPTAYLMLKYFHQKDIRIEGTGNVGALNAFEVTRSKLSGVTVLVFDFVKGMCAILITRIIFGHTIWNETLAAIGVVAGHNYSPWIGFKGGRGLATAAGVSIVFYPLFLILWIAGWLVTYIISRDIHWGNIISTVFMLISSLLLICFYSQLVPVKTDELPLVISVCGMSALILVKHIQPFKELHKSKPDNL